MAITILTDVIVPESFFVAGVTGEQIRKNERAQVDSGRMRINIAHDNTKRTFDFTNAPLTISDWQRFESLFEVTDGGAYGCLLKDPKDHIATDWPIVAISGTTYQVIKRFSYTGSSEIRERTIRHLQASNFVLKLNGVVQTLNSYYTFDEDTGVVTIASTPSAAALSWSGIFYTPVHFQSDRIAWDLMIAGPPDIRRVAGQAIVLDEVME